MATQREIKKRIHSVSSTKKITRTMEMISTSKMKKMSDRLNVTRPYGEKLERLIFNLQETDLSEITGTLLNETPDPSKILVVMITGNRGLCGGYNTNVINNTIAFRKKTVFEEDKDVFFHIIGQKGLNYFRFMNIDVLKAEKNKEDKITFDQAGKLGSELIESFESGEYHEVYVSYTKVLSSASSAPSIYKLLPVTPENIQAVIGDEHKPEFMSQYILEPGPERIIKSLLPLYVKVKLYISLLESGLAEQSARRVSMKNATDAATDMVSELTIKYNRARQAKITNEIAEIVGGAAALK